MLNLAENAAKHTKSGAIVLSARARKGRLIELAVSDTGPGIAATERSKVFDRFYRADGDGTAGFGLGLAIVEEGAPRPGGGLDLTWPFKAGTPFGREFRAAARWGRDEPASCRPR